MKSKSAVALPIGSSLDTDPNADAVQVRVLREMKPEQRSLLAARFSDQIRSTTLSGIRMRQPELDERQARREFARITLAPEEFEQAYGKVGSDA